MIDPIRQILDSRGFTRQQAEALRELVRECPLVLTFNVGPTTWTNQPAAATPLFGRAAGSGALPLDLTRYEQIRLVAPVTTVGATGALLQARLATTAPLTAGSYATALAAVSLAATGVIDSGWTTIPVASRVNGWLDVFGTGGDAAADPVIGTTTLWLR